MSDSTAQPGGDGQDGRLGSWKEIAVYLRAGVRSVQRWEETERLPVHRHAHDKRSTVYAFKRELDEWDASRRNTLGREEAEHDKSDFTIASSGELGRTSDVIGVEEVPLENDAAPARWKQRTRFGRLAALILTIAAAVFAVLLGVPIKAACRVFATALSARAKGTAFAYGTDVGGAAISPDGLALAFVADTQGISKLWIRALNSTNARPLTGTEGRPPPVLVAGQPFHRVLHARQAEDRIVNGNGAFDSLRRSLWSGRRMEFSRIHRVHASPRRCSASRVGQRRSIEGTDAPQRAT